MSEQVFNLFGSRIIAVVCGVGIFTPPDIQNPHALSDAVLAVAAGLLWALGDLAATEIRLTSTSRLRQKGEQK